MKAQMTVVTWQRGAFSKELSRPSFFGVETNSKEGLPYAIDYLQYCFYQLFGIVVL